MALQVFANYKGILLSPMEPFTFSASSGNNTLDAAGESTAIVGYINLSTGPGTSKVLSAAGSGKIHVVTGAVTFNNGTTNVRIGVNDVGATGLEDGTHDVYADVTSGAPLTASTVNAVTMTSGTKTIAHGDLVALVVEMTAKGGADSVIVIRTSGPTAVTPYSTIDTGSGPAKDQSLAMVSIEFDDGTVGWMDNVVATLRGNASAAFGTGSTPDEYALVFQVPFKCSAVGATAQLSSMASTDDFELILYSDPLGTPVAERTLAQDMDLADAGATFARTFATAYTLTPNTNYAIALRPTTANTLAFRRLNFGSGGANLRKATPLGTNWSQYTRSDNTGAFGSQDTTLLPMFGIWIDQLSDDVSSGGGFVGIIGGV